jgi:hypothetical protein
MKNLNKIFESVLKEVRCSDMKKSDYNGKNPDYDEYHHYHMTVGGGPLK